MKCARWLLTLPALMIATSGAAFAAEIRDKAGMFGAEAVRKAQADLNRIEREYQVPVTIETIESLDGKTVTKVLEQHAEAADAKGIYALIARRDHKTQILAHKSYGKYLTDSRMHAVREAIDDQFRKGDLDAGLTEGVSKLDATLAEARAEAGGSLKPATPPARRAAGAPVAAGRPAARTSNWGSGSLITIVLLILGGLLVFRIIGGLFSAARGGGGYGPGYGGGPGRMGGPGYGGGGPGYGGGYGGGGGGGGFMSSLFGGIGGAVAGNWLYDKFSGGHHGGYTDQTSYGAAPDAGIPDQAAAGTSWDQPNADAGDDWGSTNAADAGTGGGDWGGTGGGDWGGGGGGGGDWGGGAGDAGGDWGGGGGTDNGGGW